MIRYYKACPKQLHIASRDFKSCPLLISKLFASITKLVKMGDFRVSYSGFQMKDSLENPPNEIICMNSLSLFLPTINSEYQILNNNCDPNRYQYNIRSFVSTLDIKSYLSYITFSLTKQDCT